MSNRDRRPMHDEGPFVAAAIHHAQAPMTGHCFPCPYEDKVISNGTTARMVLMFLRGLIEEPQKTPVTGVNCYNCPMMRCHKPFAEPMQLIQHLLSCPELPNGEFVCEKCNCCHGFPTTEKEWDHWTGWKPQVHHQPQDSNIQRKRSFGSRMKAGFTLKKRNPSHKQQSSVDSRPSTAASDASSTFSGRCVDHSHTHSHHHHHHHASHQHARGVFTGQGGNTGFTDLQRPILPPALPDVNGSGMFWPGFSSDASCDLPSTTASIVSTLETNMSGTMSQNTSQTTLFTPSLAQYHSPSSSGQESSNALTPQPYMFSPHPQSPYEAGSASMSTHPSSSAMSLDEPPAVTAPALSPVELRPAVPTDSPSWWGVKVEMETPRPSPPASGPDVGFMVPTPMAGILTGDVVPSGLTTPTSPSKPCVLDHRHASPFFPLHQLSAHTMARGLSHESMQTGMSALYETPGPEGGRQLEALSPHSEHSHGAISVHRKANLESPTEELVCDECQWKPRGVRENLKGYLRKHKNTHKGLRLPCDVEGCTKTFSRLDNLKKHKKDKHGIEDCGGAVGVPPGTHAADDYADQIEEDAEARRPGTVESGDIRGMAEDYSMLWPALHF